jgi:hypothetical protein
MANPRPNPDTLRTAEALYEWLLDRTEADLPNCSAIGSIIAQRMTFRPDAYRVHQALLWLARNSMILLRTTSAHQHIRGPMIIRLSYFRGDRLFLTPGCPTALIQAVAPDALPEAA